MVLGTRGTHFRCTDHLFEIEFFKKIVNITYQLWKHPNQSQEPAE